MMNASSLHSSAENGSNYDRKTELKAFDETKAGVKGLFDAGIRKLPPFFVIPTNDQEVLAPINPEESSPNSTDPPHFQIPVIDLKGLDGDGFRRGEIVEEIRRASETFGFFQVLNHGIGDNLMTGMIEGIRRFNEGQTEVKKEYYSLDYFRKVTFNSNFDLYQTKAANWRDTLFCVMAPDAPDPEELPIVCRFSAQCAIGVKSQDINQTILYYKVSSINVPNHKTCHSPPSFLPILIHDHVGGLQALHQGKWVDIPPVTRGLVVNLGDLLQLISNDRFKSPQHRVLVNKMESRMSVACFFRTLFEQSRRIYGPIKELISKANPPLYKETTVEDYITCYDRMGLGSSTPALAHKLRALSILYSIIV